MLFTDFGSHGPYTGQVKAVLHQIAPGIPAIDLFADAPVGSPKPSAYLLGVYAAWFPVGTVFLCIVRMPRKQGSRTGWLKSQKRRASRLRPATSDCLIRPAAPAPF